MVGPAVITNTKLMARLANKSWFARNSGLGRLEAGLDRSPDRLPGPGFAGKRGEDADLDQSAPGVQLLRAHWLRVAHRRGSLGETDKATRTHRRQWG